MDDRLELWNTATNLEINPFYFIHILMTPNTKRDLKFAVKNLSTKYTAENVTIRVVDVGTPNPSFTEQILFSLDESTFVEILSLGDISPTAMTQEITMRNFARSDAKSGRFTIRVQMSDWTV